MAKSFDEIRNDVLTENTAQTVFKYLQEQESYRLHMQARWIWELLQNARDASSGNTNLVASVEYDRGELVFRHNGRGFTQKEIVHLIYHGSTKTEDHDSIGKFGSGFLTTHLLSPEINVSGRLNEGQQFDFHLSREASSVETLRRSMDESWEEFRSSLSSSTESTSCNITTEFRYPIENDAACAVEAGIATLRLCAPLVVVFNHEFTNIHVETSDVSVDFAVDSRSSLNQDALREIEVAEKEKEIPSERKFLLAEGEKASVAIQVESSGDGRTCLAHDDTPRLFLGFPLMGTEDFSFPAVINSFGFTPTEYRDGIYLGHGENESNIQNGRVIEEACELHVKLVNFAAESGLRNIYELSHIPPIPEPKWLRKPWLQDRLSQRLIEGIRQTPGVLCERIPVIPKDSKLPFAEEDAGVGPLWT